METSEVQKLSTEAIAERMEITAEMIMVEATKEGGMHFVPSARAIGASVKYIKGAKDTYRGNAIVEGTIERIGDWRGENNGKFDYRTLDAAEVLRNVDEIVPYLESEGEQGAQAKSFLYGLAEAMTGASGSGFMGTGERTNEGEAKFLDDLKAHLRM